MTLFHRHRAKEDPSQEPYRAHQLALFGRLRDLTAHVQSLLDIVLDLQDCAKRLADPKLRRSELQATLDARTLVATNDFKEVDARLAEARGILEQDGRTYSDWGDEIGHISSSWLSVRATWPRTIELDRAQEQLTGCSEALRRVAYFCARITIPDRIRIHLQLLPIGGVLDLSASYGDELRGVEERREFLKYLARYPRFVDGLIEPENYRILRAATSIWRRLVSLLITIVIALTGFGMIALACLWGDVYHLPAWPFTGQHRENLFSGYVFLLAGALAHIVINLLKQDRAASATVTALPDWLLRIHVKETSFFISAVALALGPLAMGFVFPSLDWKTAFFVGYSYDSFVDLFVKRFERAVPKVVDFENIVFGKEQN